jgi:hypothetical protein
MLSLDKNNTLAAIACLISGLFEKEGNMSWAGRDSRRVDFSSLLAVHLCRHLYEALLCWIFCVFGPYIILG